MYSPPNMVYNQLSNSWKHDYFVSYIPDAVVCNRQTFIVCCLHLILGDWTRAGSISSITALRSARSFVEQKVSSAQASQSGVLTLIKWKIKNTKPIHINAKRQNYPWIGQNNSAQNRVHWQAFNEHVNLYLSLKMRNFSTN